MDYDPRHLRALLAVAEHGSFNRAATALGLTQPAISKGIAALERATGAPLFVRGIRGVSLTKAGQVVERVARSTLALSQNAKDEVAALARGSAGRLRIGATPSAMLGLVPVACANLGKATGPMELTICEGLDDELLPALEGGEIDLLIGPVADSCHSDAHITEAVLLHERVSIGVRSGHELATCRSLRLADVIDRPWILPSRGSRFHALVEAAFLAAALPWPKDVITTSSLPAQEMLALNSGRLVLCTEIQHLARKPELIVIPIENGPSRRFGWRRLEDARPSMLQLLMIAHLENVVAERLTKN